MIREIEISGFKRYLNQKFSINNLTILAGLNGSGKTTLIQSFILMRRASANLPENISLNEDEGLQLGTADSVRNWANTGVIEFKVTSETAGLEKWQLEVPSDSSLYLKVASRPSEVSCAFENSPRSFTYISAERLGPRSILKAAAVPDEMIEVGERGQYAAQVVEALGGKVSPYPDRFHPTSNTPQAVLLKYEVEKWLGEITTPVEIDTVPFLGSAVNAMQFRVDGSDWVRAPNMGFGISYALPIILGGLIAKPGGLFIVENPEAHLHPAGQSRMGVFLTWLAGRGVQVIVETHSDHILNGVRRGIAEYEYLTHDKATVNFFETEISKPHVQELKFNSSAGMSNWPEGFFDQYQIDVSTLGRLRRRSENWPS